MSDVRDAHLVLSCTVVLVAYSGVTVATKVGRMVKFLLWCILLVLCWPVALLALVLYPLVWILMLPFRLVGIAVGGVFDLLRALITLPARVLSGPRHA